MPTQASKTYVAEVSSSAEYESLEPGSYNGVCIGFSVRNYPSFNDPNKLEPKIKYIFQIALDGQCTYVSTRPMKIILGEKANLYILLNSWFGVTIDKIKEKYGESFPCESVVGKPAQLILNQVDSKDGQRKYLNIANVLKVRKGTKVDVTPDAIPAYLAKDADCYWADGITVKEEVKATAPLTPPSVQPFGCAKNGADPTVPANTKITQGNPAQYVPPAAPPIQEQAAPEVDDDDDSDLPF